MNDGFFKTAAATPSIKVADCEYNKNAILDLMREAEKRGVGAVVFPELCLTGYTCGDLFRDRTLISAAQKALGDILKQSKGMNLLAVIGLPVPVGANLYNAARSSAAESCLGWRLRAIFRITASFMRRGILRRGRIALRFHFAERPCRLATA